MTLELIEFLPVLVLAIGLLMIVAGALTLLMFGLRWRPAVLYCCRCAWRWSGRDKFCPHCITARGRTTPPPLHRLPTHDWQGYLDTGPIPVIRKDVLQ